MTKRAEIITSTGYSKENLLRSNEQSTHIYLRQGEFQMTKLPFRFNSPIFSKKFNEFNIISQLWKSYSLTPLPKMLQNHQGTSKIKSTFLGTRPKGFSKLLHLSLISSKIAEAVLIALFLCSLQIALFLINVPQFSFSLLIAANLSFSTLETLSKETLLIYPLTNMLPLQCVPMMLKSNSTITFITLKHSKYLSHSFPFHLETPTIRQHKHLQCYPQIEPVPLLSVFLLSALHF